MTTTPCKHDNAYFFHENAPEYCPDCNCYVDGDFIIHNIVNQSEDNIINEKK